MSLAEDFPKMVVDQSAETFKELLESWPKGDKALYQFCQQQVESGAWEKVNKRIGSRLVMAFRRASTNRPAPKPKKRQSCAVSPRWPLDHIS